MVKAFSWRLTIKVFAFALAQLVIFVSVAFADLEIERYAFEGAPKLQHHLQGMAEDIAAVAGYKGPLKVRIYNSLQPNAIAMPSGDILVTSGLLMQLDDINAIEAVLAHEVAHLAKRHFDRKQSRLQDIQRTVTYRRGSDEDKQLAILSRYSEFSQKYELEADKYAAKYLKKLRRSSSSLIAALRSLEAVETFREAFQVDADMPTIRTHPATPERITAVAKLKAHKKGQATPTVSYRQLLQAEPIFRSARQSIFKDRALYFRSLNAAVMIGAQTNVEALTLNSAHLHRGNDQYYLSVASTPMDQKSYFSALLDNDLFSYKRLSVNAKAGGPLQFLLMSKINANECIQGAVNVVEKTAIAYWQSHVRPCKSVKRFSEDLSELLKVVPKETANIDQKFNLRLHIMPIVNAAMEQEAAGFQKDASQNKGSIAASNASLNFDGVFDEWLNLNVEQGYVKRLY